jgi:hypothetical protein
MASSWWGLVSTINTMLDNRIPTIVVDATSYSPSMVCSTCRPITCVTAHVSLHRGDGYCRNYPHAHMRISDHFLSHMCHHSLGCKMCVLSPFLWQVFSNFDPIFTTLPCTTSTLRCCHCPPTHTTSCPRNVYHKVPAAAIHHIC